MKIVRVSGGIGNQLFQYAFGRATAELTSDNVYFDISWFDTYDRYQLRLPEFGLEPAIATRDQIFDIFPLGDLGMRAGKQLSQRLPTLASTMLNYTKERHPDSFAIGLDIPRWWTYHPAIQESSGDMYYDGYWQCEAYFSNITNELQRDLSIDLPTSDEVQRLIEMIERGPSISVHFRRGDYVDTGNQLPLEYYYAAISRMEERHDDCTFFLFSDDIDWVKDEFELGTNTSYTFVDTDSPISDMALMSRCDHHIIANSTFSWWGAWLNSDQESVVIVPSKWFKWKNTGDFDLVPKRWTILDWNGI